jgi:ABC-type lipoprotein release transport system permease subunit
MQSQTPQTVKFAAFKAEIEQSLGTVDLIEYNESILPQAEERRKFMFLYMALMLR